MFYFLNLPCLTHRYHRGSESKDGHLLSRECHGHDRAEICCSSDSIGNLDLNSLMALLVMDLKWSSKIFHLRVLINRILAVKILGHYLQLHSSNLLRLDAEIVRRGSWDQQFNDLLSYRFHYECSSEGYQ